MTLSTLKRAWNLAATLLLASPALGEVGWNLVVWTVYLAFLAALGATGFDVLTRARKAQETGTRSSRPAVGADPGSIPGASTRNLKERDMKTAENANRFSETCAECGAVREKKTMILDLADFYGSGFYCNLACFRTAKERAES